VANRQELIKQIKRQQMINEIKSLQGGSSVEPMAGRDKYALEAMQNPQKQNFTPAEIGAGVGAVVGSVTPVGPVAGAMGGGFLGEVARKGYQMYKGEPVTGEPGSEVFEGLKGGAYELGGGLIGRGVGKGLSKMGIGLREGAEQVGEAAVRQNVPTPGPMLYGSKQAQENLGKSMSIPGWIQGRVMKPVWEAIRSGSKDVIKRNTTLAKDEIEDLVMDRIALRVNKLFEPAERFYQGLSDNVTKQIRFGRGKTVPYKDVEEIMPGMGKKTVTKTKYKPSDYDQWIDDLDNIDVVKADPKGPEARIIRKYKERLKSIKNLNDFRTVKTKVGKEITDALKSASRDTNKADALIDLKHKMVQFEHKKLVEYASNSKRDPLFAHGVVNGLEVSNQQYTKAYEQLKQLKNFIKVKGRTKGGFLEYLDEKEPYDILKKITNTNKPESLAFLKEFDQAGHAIDDLSESQIPSLFELVKEFKLSQYMEKSVGKDGVFNPDILFKELDNLHPKTKRLFFNPEQLQKIDDLKLLWNNAPKFTPMPGTAATIETMAPWNLHITVGRGLESIFRSTLPRAQKLMAAPGMIQFGRGMIEDEQPK